MKKTKLTIGILAILTSVVVGTYVFRETREREEKKRREAFWRSIGAVVITRASTNSITNSAEEIAKKSTSLLAFIEATNKRPGAKPIATIEISSREKKIEEPCLARAGQKLRLRVDGIVFEDKGTIATSSIGVIEMDGQEKISLPLSEGKILAGVPTAAVEESRAPAYFLSAITRYDFSGLSYGIMLGRTIFAAKRGSFSIVALAGIEGSRAEKVSSLSFGVGAFF